MGIDKSKRSIKSVPLVGGMITSRESMLIPHGGFSSITNMRPTSPGFEGRLGSTRHCTSADTSTEAMTLYQFSKGSKSEKHFYAQRLDGSVDEATDNPPTVTAAAFGTEKLAAVSGCLPATWNNIKDFCLFSDGKRQHQIWSGNNTPVSKFVVFKSTTVPAIPEDGEDYSIEAADGQSSTVADLSSLGTNEFFFVMTPIPIKGLTVTMSGLNDNASVLTMQYWKGTWATKAITDGTDVAGDTLKQSGDITWTQPTDELPHYQFGRSGYWYKFKVSATLDSSTSMSAVEYDTDWQSVTNVWNGVIDEAIEAKVLKMVDGVALRYSIFGTNAIDLGQLQTNEYFYFATIDPISGMYIDTGNTPHITNAAVTGSSNISFFANTSPSQDYLEARDANLLTAGFEEGQAIVITGTSSNNATHQALRVTSTRIYFEPGALTDELDQSAKLEYAVDTTALDGLDVWTGTSFEAMTSLNDGTVGLTQPGWVTWDRTAKVPQTTNFQNSSYHAYWYRVSFDKALSNNVNIGIQVMPYFSIDSLGLGKCNAVWKDRAVYTFAKLGQYLYISEKDSPLVLNGSDYGIIEAGDGRPNPVRSMKKFHNELIAWQEETGEAGGCTTLFEGYSPTTFGKLVLSTQIGIMNGKCSAVVEGVKTSTATDEKVKTLAFWLSRHGVMVTDGQTIEVISDDVQNFFDPTDSNSIRRGYEDKMWLGYDSAHNILRVGLVTGTATVPNTFLNFDLISWGMSFDTLAEPLSCIAEVEADSGDTLMLQYAGGADDGFIYRVNTGTDDIVGATPTITAIDHSMTIELDGEGEDIQVGDVLLRCKAQTAGDITLTSAKDGNSTYDDPIVLPMTARTVGDSHRKNRTNVDERGNRVSIKLQNNVLGETMYLGDLGFDIEQVKGRNK